MNRWRRCNEKQKPVKVAPPLTKLDIPNIWKKNCYSKQYNKTNKASKIYLTRHVQKKINNVEYHVTLL